MRIVIAPDSFKESMTALKAAEAIKKGINEALPDAKTVLVPMADGGEGTVQALIDSTDGNLVELQVHDPLMRQIQSSFGLLGVTNTAIIEMAAASRIEHLSEDEKDPSITSTFGTGELIKAAINKACTTIIVGIGGSATNDGGTGMMLALGAKFRDHSGKPLSPKGGLDLGKIAEIDLTELNRKIKGIKIIIASDVDNPLLGDTGASRVFGPQKGADTEQVEQLEKNMHHYADLIENLTGKNLRDYPGAGAAGGLGFGMMAVLNARLSPGFNIVAELTGIDQKIQKSDLVITGEGKIDRQTHHGKTPWGVAMLAKKHGIPIVAFAGQVRDNAAKHYSNEFKDIIEISDPDIDLKTALDQGPQKLYDAVAKYFNLYYS